MIIINRIGIGNDHFWKPQFNLYEYMLLDTSCKPYYEPIFDM